MKSVFWIAAAILPATLLATPTSAVSDFIIRQASFANGVVTIQGETAKPGSRVRLDGRFATRSGNDGRFAFRVRYHPEDCEVEIRTARAARSASLAGCVARAAGGDNRPPLTREPTPLLAEPGGGPPDVIFKTPKIVDPTMGDPAHAFDVPDNLVVPRE